MLFGSPEDAQAAFAAGPITVLGGVLLTPAENRPLPPPSAGPVFEKGPVAGPGYNMGEVPEPTFALKNNLWQRRTTGNTTDEMQKCWEARGFIGFSRTKRIFLLSQVQFQEANAFQEKYYRWHWLG